MSAGGFGALTAARELEAAGIDPQHAEAIVAVHRNSAAQATTKADLAAAVAGLRTDLAALESRMLKLACGLSFAIVLSNVTLTVALVKLL